MLRIYAAPVQGVFFSKFLNLNVSVDAAVSYFQVVFFKCQTREQP